MTITRGYPVTYSDPALTELMAPTLRSVANGRAAITPPWTGAEDFAYFQQQIPGFYFFLGVTPRTQNPAKAPRNHSPYFFAVEGALPVGVRSMTQLVLDYVARAVTATP